MLFTRNSLKRLTLIGNSVLPRLVFLRIVLCIILCLLLSLFCLKNIKKSIYIYNSCLHAILEERNQCWNVLWLSAALKRNMFRKIWILTKNDCLYYPSSFYFFQFVIKISCNHLWNSFVKIQIILCLLLKRCTTSCWMATLQEILSKKFLLIKEIYFSQFVTQTR